MKNIYKVLFAFVFICFAFPVNAKEKEKKEVKIVLEPDAQTGEFEYAGVVNVENVTKPEMFERAKKWTLLRLKTVDNNIQFDTTNMSIINSSTLLYESVKRGILVYPAAYCSFKMSIDFKDGKYRFRFYDVLVLLQEFEATPQKYDGKKLSHHGKWYNEYLVEHINLSFLQLANELEAAVKGTTRSDW